MWGRCGRLCGGERGKVCWGVGEVRGEVWGVWGKVREMGVKKCEEGVGECMG